MSSRNIKKVKNGWQVRVTRVCPKTGRRVFRKGTRRTRKDAQRLLVQFIAELDGSRQAPERVRFGAFVNSWMAGKKGRIRMSTAKQYAQVLDHDILPTFGDFFVDAIEPRDVETWLQDLATRVVPPTANSRLALLKRVLRAAGHPVQVEPLAVYRKPKARTAAELAQFLEAMRETNYIRMFYLHALLMATTGIRFGELAALKWSDVHGDYLRVERAAWMGQIGPTKTSVAREVPIVPEVAELLEPHRREQMKWQASHYIFATRRGTILKYPAQLNRPFRRASEEAGLEPVVTCHVLRHTFNNLLRRESASQAVVRSIVGHSSEDMTTHYSHVGNDEKRAVVLRVFGGTQS